MTLESLCVIQAVLEQRIRDLSLLVSTDTVKESETVSLIVKVKQETEQALLEVREHIQESY